MRKKALLICVTAVFFMAGCGDDNVAAGCTESEFACDDGTCIETFRVCNGVTDCAEGEDEEGCAAECTDEIVDHRYYLDANNGDDGNNGSCLHPWLTLDHARETVVEGDTVIVREGSYGEYAEDSDVNRTGWVVYQSEIGHRPFLTGISLGDYEDPHTSAYLVFDGFDIEGSVWMPYTDYVQILNCRISHTSIEPNSYGVGGRQSDHITIERSDITHVWRGVSCWGNDWRISMNTIHHIAEDAINGHGTEIVVEGNRIWDITADYGEGTEHCDGVHFEGDDMSEISILANEVYGGRMQGLTVYGHGTAQNILLANNLVYSIEGEAARVMISGLSSGTVVNNTVISTEGAGMRFEIGSREFQNHITAMYNNIFSRLTVDANNGEYHVSFDSHGNNIFGNDPSGAGGDHPFVVDAGSLVDTVPEFTDAENDDYTPATGSVAVDFGDMEHAPPTDKLGNGRVGLPEAGCFEYLGP